MNNITEERKGFESLGLSYPPLESVSVKQQTIAGVSTYWFTPTQITGSEVAVYLHGGGFIYGSIKSHRAMVSHIANAIRRKVLLIEYSLAPEKPFPTALNETVAVINELLLNNADFQYSIVGDSAGGNLAMSTTLSIRAMPMEQPLYQILISPWVKMNPIYPSYTENETLDPIITREFVNYAAANYANREDWEHPLASPINNDLSNLSPTLILAGSKEVLRDDSLFLHEKLLKAKSHSTLKTYDDATHVWMLTNIDSVVSRETLEIMADFVASTNRISLQGVQADAAVRV